MYNVEKYSRYKRVRKLSGIGFGNARGGSLSRIIRA